MLFLDSITDSFYELSQYLFDPSQRIYIAYLVGSILLAIPVFIKLGFKKSPLEFLKFLFPSKIWLDKSAKIDYVILVLNKLCRAIIFSPVLIAIAPIALAITDVYESSFGAIVPLSDAKWVVMLSFTLILFILDDLTRFLLHLALHKIPFLWELHKVHHSAKVLTPFTIYRAHPIESYLFACRLAISQGVSIGISYCLFGPTLSVIEFAGANIFVFLFNFLGSNLRHSHIKISWGDTIENWFISPTQHQIHHSQDPKHFDKNIGSALAIWDRMLGSLVKASSVKRLEFGFGETFKEHDSIVGIYWLPMKNSLLKIFSIRTKTDYKN